MLRLAVGARHNERHQAPMVPFMGRLHERRFAFLRSGEQPRGRGVTARMQRGGAAWREQRREGGCSGTAEAGSWYIYSPGGGNISECKSVTGRAVEMDCVLGFSIWGISWDLGGGGGRAACGHFITAGEAGVELREGWGPERPSALL